MLIPDKLATFQSPNYIAVGRRICVSYPADLDQISTAKKLMTEIEIDIEPTDKVERIKVGWQVK